MAVSRREQRAGGAGRRAPWPFRVLRAFVLVLALPVASSGALPFWAQLFDVEAPHVCHCALERHDCVCAKCNPEHEETLRLTTESLTGRCGDDDVAFPGKLLWAVLAPSSVLAPAVARRPVDLDEERPLESLSRPPPTPPPRSSSSAV